jgi:hypothetical protein
MPRAWCSTSASKAAGGNRRPVWNACCSAGGQLRAGSDQVALVHRRSKPRPAQAASTVDRPARPAHEPLRLNWVSAAPKWRAASPLRPTAHDLPQHGEFDFTAPPLVRVAERAICDGFEPLIPGHRSPCPMPSAVGTHSAFLRQRRPGASSLRVHRLLQPACSPLIEWRRGADV